MPVSPEARRSAAPPSRHSNSDPHQPHRGVFHVQSAVPYLNDSASIILNGSVISVLGIPGYSAYAGEGRGAMDGTDHGIGVVASRHPRQRGCAGRNANSDLGACHRTPEAVKAFEKRICLSTPLGRIGEPDDVSKTVLFLASDDSAHIRGRNVHDGGATASATARRSIGYQPDDRIRPALPTRTFHCAGRSRAGRLVLTPRFRSRNRRRRVRRRQVIPAVMLCRVEIPGGLQRAGQRFFAMLRPDLDAIGRNEFGIVHADKAEHPAQIGFQVLAAAAGVPAP